MKKKLSFVLAAIMLVANFAISTFAADTNITFTDVTDTTKYSKAILTMVRLGIVNGYAEDNTFRPEAGIKRSEFTAVITRAMGIANAVSGVSPFTDVAQDHWALKNILAASSREIVNGMGDGTFHPEDNVTYEQALKMVVCALNYKNEAERNGGWAAGAYFTKAAQLGLTKDVALELQKGSPAPRGVVAQIMYNALNVKVGDPETGKETEDTFLNEFLNMGMAEGTVVGVETDITADCTVGLGIGQMAIMPKNGKIMIVDFSDLGDKESMVKYLGQEISIFYKISQTGETDKLTYIDAQTSKNTEIEISYEDIISYDGGVLNYYNAQDRKTNAKIDEANITVYYNKKAVTSNIPTSLKKWLGSSNADFIYGNVVLKDSGSDGTFDMIEIMDYKYMVALRAVSNADFTATNKMKFKDDSKKIRIIETVELNPDTNSYSFTIEDEKGTKLEPTSIKTNSVVMVAASQKGDMMTVKVSNQTVEGKIGGYSDVDNTIEINGQEYKITDDCIAYFEDQGTQISSGKKGKFHLDAFGNIAYGTLNVDTDTTVLAYLITAAYMEDTDSLTLRAFVPGSGYKSYQVSKKATLNGQPKGAEAIKSELDTNALNFNGNNYNTQSASQSNQLIKMEVIEGEVTEIVTIDTQISGAIDNSAGLQLYHSEPKEYKHNGTEFKEVNGTGKFFTNSSTVFISVPQDRTETTSYYKREASWFKKTPSYTLEPVNVSNSKMAEIVLIYEKVEANKVDEDTTPLTVLGTNVKDVYSAEEGSSKSFTVFTNSSSDTQVIIDTQDYATADSIIAGDLFRYVTTTDGKATDIQPKISYSDVQSVLSAKLTNGVGYDWTNSKFEFETSHKRSDGSGKPYVSAYIYNVISKSDDNTGLYVTRDGFVDGKIDDTNATWIYVSGSTKYLKMSEKGNKVVSKNEQSDVALTIEDILTEEYDKEKCSKIAVINHNNKNATTILIYE